ncbi:MAG: PspC domain-containing protein [Oscillospiraceae bacterium]|nr:PspC domain-containing protein [Oscillospiraceae bacterium]
MMKKLYKSNNRMICGVCAGIAEYLGIDPTVVRLIWAALGLTGTGILLYIIAALVMPENMDVM